MAASEEDHDSLRQDAPQEGIVSDSFEADDDNPQVEHSRKDDSTLNPNVTDDDSTPNPKVTDDDSTPNPKVTGDDSTLNPKATDKKIDIVDNGGDERERDIWDHPVEFVLSCIAMSVGLGNFWRFPTVAYENGGGAFLIPYLIVLFFVGRPLYFLEMSLGQFTSQGPVEVFNMVPAVKGIGYAMTIASLSVVSYYSSIIAIALFYLSMSFSAVLPWSVCDPDWADLDTCVEVKPQSLQNETQLNDTSLVKNNLRFFGPKDSSQETLEISALQYFRDFLLHEPKDLSSGPGVPDWRLSLCLLAAWIIICAAIIKGVKSSGKASYVMALFPYVGMLTLLVQGSLLPGAREGILNFITPRWEEILQPKVWYNAVTQMFFSLSVSFGPIMMFSSHNPFRQNVYRDALIVSLMDTFTSLFAGFTIFSVLGYLKYVTKADSFGDIVSGGTTLVFVAYPTAIAAFEVVPQLFSVLFFLVLLTLGFGSATALVGAFINLMIDKFPKLNSYFITIAVCVGCFFLGLVYVTPGGQWVLNLVDFFGGGFIIYILATIETISVFWIYGYRNYARDIRFMLGIDLGFYWRFCFQFFAPLFLPALFIYFLVQFEMPTYGDNLPYPVIGQVFGWLLFSVAMSTIVIAFFFTYKETKGFGIKERLLETLRPNEKHRPRMDNDSEAWKVFCATSGSQRIDQWKALAIESLEHPDKLREFNKLFDSVSDNWKHWKTLAKDK